MAQITVPIIPLAGPSGTIPIRSDDTMAVRLAMLIEGQCLGLGSAKSSEKYGFSKQRYYQLLRGFEAAGTAALQPRKTGPHTKHVRTENVMTQIIRHRFLDPDASAEVIAQKMRQTGISVSTRSVERTITDYGLQKKTLRVSAARYRTHG